MHDQFIVVIVSGVGDEIVQKRISTSPVTFGEAQSAPGLVFADCIVSPFLAATNRINLISVLTIWWYLCVESSLVLLEETVCYD